MAVKYPRLGYLTVPTVKYYMGLPDSLTSTASAMHDTSTITLSKKLVEFAGSLPPRQAELIRGFAFHGITRMAGIFVRLGNTPLARKIIASGDSMGVPFPALIRIGALLPRPVALLGRSAFLRLRKLMKRTRYS